MEQLSVEDWKPDGSEYPGIYAAACEAHPIAGGRSGENR